MADQLNALAPQTSSVNALLDKINPMAIYRRNVEMPKRVYGESLLKSFMGRTEVPMTETDFTPQELDVLSQLVNESYQKKVAYFSRPKEQLLADAADFDKQAAAAAAMEKKDPASKGMFGLTSSGLASQAKLLREAAQNKIPSDFSFGYEDFMHSKVPKQDINWRDTLGRFRYKVDPTTNTFRVYDTYEFSNKAHQAANDAYAAMTPVQRFKTALSDFFGGREAALGEAYLGTEKGVPMNINVRGPR